MKRCSWTGLARRVATSSNGRSRARRATRRWAGTGMPSRTSPLAVAAGRDAEVRGRPDRPLRVGQGGELLLHRGRVPWLGPPPSPAGRLTVPADVAQLARASACHAEGRGFESHHPLSEKPPEIGGFRRSRGHRDRAPSGGHPTSIPQDDPPPGRRRAPPARSRRSRRDDPLARSPRRSLSPDTTASAPASRARAMR